MTERMRPGGSAAGHRGRPLRPAPGASPSDARRGMPPGRGPSRSVPRQALPARGAPGPLGERVLRFLAAVAGLCAVAAFPASALFDLHSVEVRGNQAVPASQLLGQIGLNPGESAFRVNVFQIRARLRSDPRVDDVWVSLGFPHRLVVTVRERAPVAALAMEGGYVLLGEDGVAIARTPGPAPYLPLRVDGLDPRSVQTGTVVPDPSVRLGAGVASGRLFCRVVIGNGGSGRRSRDRDVTERGPGCGRRVRCLGDVRLQGPNGCRCGGGWFP